MNMDNKTLIFCEDIPINVVLKMKSSQGERTNGLGMKTTQKNGMLSGSFPSFVEASCDLVEKSYGR